MKPKKNPGADLRSRRGLFFEIGMLVALVGAVAVFSLARKEMQIAIPFETGGFETTIDDILRTVPKPPEEKVMRKTMKILTDYFTVTRDNKIETGYGFPEYGYEDPLLPPLGDGKETIIEDTIFIHAEEMPSFMGGDLNTFRNWVLARIKYPKIAQETNLQGKVILQFVVEKDGSITNIEVARTPDSILSDEAVRVLAASPRWEPGRHRNNPVRIRYTLPVEFTLSN